MEHTISPKSFHIAVLRMRQGGAHHKSKEKRPGNEISLTVMSLHITHGI